MRAFPACCRRGKIFPRKNDPVENLKWFWKGCKPNFVCALASGENHLSQQPVPGTCPAFAELGAGRPGVPYLALHPMGFSVPRQLLGER
jgi:hypothetical protein